VESVADQEAFTPLSSVVSVTRRIEQSSPGRKRFVNRGRQ
jgi:hypothetical protein